MKCTNCGEENLDTSKFCYICGFKLPVAEIQGSVTPPHPYSQPAAPAGQQHSSPLNRYTPGQLAPRDPLTQAALKTGLISIVGGVLIVLGFLLPWFSAGDSLSSLASLAGASIPSVGTGAQFTLMFIFLGFIAVTGGAWSTLGGLGGLANDFGLDGLLAGGGALVVILGLFLLLIGVLLIIIPIFAGLTIKTGFQAYKARLAQDFTSNDTRYIAINDAIFSARKRAKISLIILAVFFAPVLLFMGLTMLGSGLFLVLIGNIAFLLIPTFVDSHLLAYQRSRTL